MTNYNQVSRFLISTNVEEMHHRLEVGLQRRFGSDLSLKELHIPRVFPRSNETFSIQYSLLLQSGTDAGTKKLILCGAQLKSSAEASTLAASWGKDVVFCDELNLVIPIFPNDPVLNLLMQLESGDIIPKFLNNWVHTQSRTGEESFEFNKEILGYRLEKRCTISCIVKLKDTTSNRSRTVKTIAKVIAPRKTKKLARKLAHVYQYWNSEGETPELTIPEVYESDSASGLFLMEYLPGKSMHDLLGAEEFVPACLAGGRLLRKLHSIPKPASSARTREKELEGVRKWVELVSPFKDDCAGMFESALELLKSRSADTDNQYVETCLHGDFYDKQVLYEGTDSASLIDFDNLASGDSAVDVGNFMAHLELRNLQNPEGVQLVNKGGKAFMDSYGDRDEGFHDRINWWKSAALIRLAAIYALRPRWHHLPPYLLANAADSWGGLTQKQRKAETQ